MNAALREVTGRAMADMDAPGVYLPFSALEWLISLQPKTDAASAKQEFFHNFVLGA